MVDRAEKKRRRQEILDRLNSNDSGPGNRQRGSKERSAKNEAEREEALAKGNCGFGQNGITGGM